MLALAKGKCRHAGRPEREAGLMASESSAEAGRISGYQPEGPGGMSGFAAAARDGRLEIAKLLLDAKADPNQVDINGITPLISAISNHHLPLRAIVSWSAERIPKPPINGAARRSGPPSRSATGTWGKTGNVMDREGALQLVHKPSSTSAWM